MCVREGREGRGLLRSNLLLYSLGRSSSGHPIRCTADPSHTNTPTPDQPTRKLTPDPTTTQVSDFGLSRPICHGETHVSMGSAVGTIAYSAPEIFACSISKKPSDVYSFGIMRESQQSTSAHRVGDLRVGQSTWLA